jgi:hypothetical protein
MKQLKHKSETPETLETWCHLRQQPSWYGTTVASKLGLGGRREEQPSVHLGEGAGLPFLLTSKVDGGAGADAELLGPPQAQA